MEELEKTTLTLQIGNCSTSWTTDTDCVTAEELLWALTGLMVSHTFSMETVFHSMADFIEEHSDYRVFKESDIVSETVDCDE